MKILKRIIAVLMTCGSEYKCWRPTYIHFRTKEKYQKVKGKNHD